MGKSKLRWLYVLSMATWIAVVCIALNWGAVSGAPFSLIKEIRLPRVILASAVGMGLAVAGSALQALFCNPLCDPYTLGISSGAALGAVLGISLGFQATIAGFAGTAFLGALLFAGVLYLVSLRPAGTSLALLLTGIMLGFFGNSLVALWMALTDTQGLQSALVWLFGDLSGARKTGALFLGVWVFFLSGLIWRNWRGLDAMLMGEEKAQSLGVEVPRIRQSIIGSSSILIGLCVSAAGMIGFVGLIVPHFVRRFVGSLHFHLIPLCAIWGAILLTFSDCISRILIRPYELPVGVVTALIGAPLFLVILLKKQEAL
jgi:iron complex transport system permease protein